MRRSRVRFPQAAQIPLPDLPAGKYQMWFGAFMSYAEYGSFATLGYDFTIGADGTFTAIGPACQEPCFQPLGYQPLG